MCLVCFPILRLTLIDAVCVVFVFVFLCLLLLFGVFVMCVSGSFRDKKTNTRCDMFPKIRSACIHEYTVGVDVCLLCFVSLGFIGVLP